MIPWTVLQQFRDRDFPALSGARIVRIAVHPDMPRAGYGSRAVQLLRAYFQVRSHALFGTHI
jgi:N-acetyltransferase 10